jgi:hypothetical protein
VSMAVAPRNGIVQLPFGYVQTVEHGHIYYIDQTVVAVQVGPGLCIVSRPRDYTVSPRPLVEQLAGYCVGRGANVLRAAVRYPLAWHQKGGLRATIAYWAREVIQRDKELLLCLHMPLYRGAQIQLSSEIGAQQAQRCWTQFLWLANALEADYPDLLGELRSELARIAKRWESLWTATLNRSPEREGADVDRDLANSVDRAFASFVQAHLAATGYGLQPTTVARLL